MRQHNDYELSVADSGNVRARFHGPNGAEETAGKWLPVDLRRAEDAARALFTALEEPGERLLQLGDALRALAFPGDVGGHFLQAMGVSQRANITLRVRLHVDAGLTWLPWEFLHCRGSSSAHNFWLATHAPLVLARHIAQTLAPPRPILLPDRPRVLVAAGSAVPGPLQAERVYSDLAEVLDGKSFQILPLAQDCDLRGLDRLLAAHQPSILHIVAHGEVRDGEGRVGMVDNANPQSVVWQTAGQLAKIFDQWQPHMVILHTCDSSGQAPDPDSISLTDALAAQGVGCVVGMRFPVTNEVAATFSREFYYALSTPAATVEHSVQMARRALGREFGFTLPWFAVPTLHMCWTQADLGPVKAEEPQPVSSVEPASRAAPVRHNLRQRDYRRFVGRGKELRQLRNLLAPQSGCPVVGVIGPAGSGKSTAALEMAHRLVERAEPDGPEFDHVIWISAQTQMLTTLGVRPRLHINSLEDVLQEIATCLDRSDLTRLSVPEQVEQLRLALGDLSVLIIVDNFETVDDPRVHQFLTELPAPTRVLLTSRLHVECSDVVRMTRLGQHESIVLLRLECERQGINLPDEMYKQLAEAADELPLIIKWAVGQLAYGLQHETVLEKLRDGTNDVSRYCFGASIESLREREPDAYQGLLAAALFAGSFTAQALSEVVGIGDGRRCDECLATLCGMNLLERDTLRFRMLPVTKRLVEVEAAQVPDRLTEFRNRQIRYYLEFLRANNPKQDHTPPSEPFWEEIDNIRGLVRWCRATGSDWDLVDLCVEYSSFIWTHGIWAELFEITDWVVEAGRKQSRWTAVAKVALDATLAHLDQFDAAAMTQRLAVVVEAFAEMPSITDELRETYLFCRATSAAIRRDAAALEYFNEALDLSRRMGVLWRQAGTLWWMGQWAYEDNRWSDAEQYFGQALTLAESCDDKRTIALVYGFMPEVSYHQGREEEAFEACERYSMFISAHGQKTSKAQLDRSVAAVHLNAGVGHLKVALQHAEQALAMYRQLARRDLVNYFDGLVRSLQHSVIELAEASGRDLKANGSSGDSGMGLDSPPIRRLADRS